MRTSFIARAAVAIAITCTAAATASAGDDDFLLRDGDRVVFYGDSITQQRLYTRYVQQYVYVRYPDLDVRFFNAGWGGDTAKGANARLERDVLHLAPTVVTLCFGMNDGRYRAADDAIAKGYEAEMERLVTRLTEAGTRVVVISPGCVDTDRKPALGAVDYNAALAGLGAAAKRVADRHDCRFIDIHTPMLRVQTELKTEDPAFTMIPDSVHPAAPGHLVMAYEILKGIGAEPVPAIGAIEHTTESAPDGASTPVGEGFALSADGPHFTPFWIDPASEHVARACGILDDFAGRHMSISGLPDGTWDVQIGGASIGHFTTRELRSGVIVRGGWSPNARMIHDEIAAKEDLYFDLWRSRRVPHLPDADAPGTPRQKLIAAGMELDAQHHALIRSHRESSVLHVGLERLPNGPNLALGRDYESSDVNTWGWNSGLTDGSWAESADDCFATGVTPKFPKHVTVDLGRTQRVGVVRFGVPAFGSTKTVHVEVSKNGKAFHAAGEHTFGQNKAERATVRFDGTPARYVRLVYVENHAEEVGYGAAFCFTTELEIYGP